MEEGQANGHEREERWKRHLINFAIYQDISLGEALYDLSKYERRSLVLKIVCYLLQLSLRTLERRPTVGIFQLKQQGLRELKLSCPQFHSRDVKSS